MSGVFFQTIGESGVVWVFLWRRPGCFWVYHVSNKTLGGPLALWCGSFIFSLCVFCFHLVLSGGGERVLGMEVNVWVLGSGRLGVRVMGLRCFGCLGAVLFFWFGLPLEALVAYDGSRGRSGFSTSSVLGSFLGWFLEYFGW